MPVGRGRKQTVIVPQDLLCALREGTMTVKEVWEEYTWRTGRVVDLENLKSRFVRLGLTKRKFRRRAFRPTVGVSELVNSLIPRLDKEDKQVLQRISDFEDGQILTRRVLLRSAKAGDIGSLIVLKEKYGLRLPMVEGQITQALPWMKNKAA